MATRVKVWNGNAELARKLKPVDHLRPHPRNARRGNLDAIAASLERFGQQRAALATGDGMIVAGNHTYLAAVQLGWTHFAVGLSDLSEEEIDAYLIADNRTADLGTYDVAMLASLIEPFAGNLTGLGFTPEEYEELIRTAAGAHIEQPDPEPPVPKDAVQTLFLPYPAEQYEQVTRWLNMIAREREVDVAGTVYVLAKEAASRL